MILIDSFGWIEFFIDGPRADQYESYFQNSLEILTPSIVLFEVYKKFKKERNEEEALLVAAQMQKTRVVHLNVEIALSAAELSLKYKLPMADSIVYATAQKEQCPVVTSDPHFENLEGVVFVK